MALADSPVLVSIPHVMVADRREVSFEPFLPGETLGRYVERTGVVIFDGPVEVWQNEHRVPQALWKGLIPRIGDQITVRGDVHGDGGGNKILRTVALVALAVAAPYAGAALAGAAGFATTGIAAGVFTAGVMIGGSLLVNALIPLPKPVAPKLAQQNADAPSYAISAASNRARPFEPMMFIFGQHKVYPDLAGNPHTFYQGDDQFLNQAFHFGVQPDITISDIRLGDTPITNYQGVDVQRSDYTGQLTLVPDNVDTIPGFDLNFADGWNARITPTNTYHVQVELAAVLYYVNPTTGAFEPRTVEVQLEYRSYPEGNWVPIGSYTNPIYATHYWALGVYREAGDDQNNRYWEQIRYGSLNAGDHTDGEQYTECRTIETGSGDSYGTSEFCTTYEWRWLPHPYQLGRPWSGVAPDPLIGYTTASGIRLTGSSNKPVRQTIGFNTGLGQYEVRLRKMQADITSNTESNAVSVTQIRAYQDTPANYYAQSRLGIRVRASSQLNGAINQLSAMVQAHTPVWTGATWEWRATSNPAWWFVRFAVGEKDAEGDRLYGGGLTGAQIDYDSIFAWAAWCEPRGLTFDYVLTENKSVHDILTMIARAGRASYTWQSGKLGVVWDAADQPFVAMVGPFNMKAGSFEVSYTDATVDEIIGVFINPARNWTADEVRVRVPGAPVLNNPLRFEMEGCRNAQLAAREINLIAASQLFHRRRVSWEMDIEGMICTRGDVVQVSHDLTVWGYSGRLRGGSRANMTLGLDTEVPITAAGAYMLLRSPFNDIALIGVSGPFGDTDNLNILSGLPADFPMPDTYPDSSPLDWTWQFDPLQTPGRRLKIVSAQPTTDEGVRFEAIDDDPNYYNSEYNPFIYTPPRDGALLAGVVFGINFEEEIINAQTDVIQVRVNWSISAAVRVNVDYAINGQLFPTIVTTDRFTIIPAHSGDNLVVRITPVSTIGNGAPVIAGHDVQGVFYALPTITGLTTIYRDDLTVLRWDPVNDVRQPRYEVRIGASWQNSQTVAVVSYPEILAVGNGRYFVAARFDAANGQVLYGTADSLQVAGATLIRNVLVTKIEHPTWNGTLTGGAFVFDGMLTLAAGGDILSSPDVLAEDDVLWYGGVVANGTYETNDANIVDIGYPAPVRVDFTIDAYALNFNENILGLSDVLAEADILNDSNMQFYNIRPQIRSAIVPGEWGDWVDYVPGLINARFFDVRIVLETRDPLIVPFVQEFTWTIDVPDLIQRGEIVTVPSAGFRITYPKPFHATPNVQITWLDAIDGDRYVLTSQDATGFNIRFYNNATPVSRQMNHISQGY